MYINIDLQLFAGEKTEKATPKKRQDARRKGQVFQSREINSAATLMVSMVFIKVLGKYIFRFMYEPLIFFERYFYEDIDLQLGYRLFIFGIMFLLKGSFIIAMANFMVAFISSWAQVGNLFTTETLRPKFDRLNPIEGFKRLFSMRSIFEFLKSFLKLLILSTISYNYMKAHIKEFMKAAELEKFQFSYILFSSAVNMGIMLASVLLVLSIFDYLFQWYQHDKQLKMSKQEIKEEYKQMEGSPEIKSKIKEKQRQSAMKRMMQDVAKADVIITNPTHYAVGLKYDDGVSDAPYVIVKGKNMVALKIREKAREHNIEIVENKPLARKLYAVLEIGDSIPAEFYEIVAEILAHVYSKDRERKSVGKI
ncbi:flagellar biosynthetic protein FlhB [Peptoclostridium litorale DSM 5388]|uniref:Flagellar biosynthetic protein FlhB n=1 Tax=Peptoclostridium litorale DSM 5388 TaxID=1121324 RepID=A0A069RDN9_PEPLI|nr:flagellar biosynthesis protein FlhB [Peptoclostridium litorale]KDR95179.1 flagellar biosynthetic protein FlhB [Peptoclostridium litorale DSM 5388]SIN73753.1 flagellar biosynthetic protein FlhB [Peptoclostridium litorale DSM 5388]